jgi:mannose-6-phosphate isomerase-like protein (cupin superfamily)
MAVSKSINPRLYILVLFIITSSLLLLPSHSYTLSKEKGEEEEEEISPEGKLFECFLQCGSKRRRPNSHELTHCEQKCVNHYEDIKRQERGGGDWAFPQTEEPWRVYERCRSGCTKQQGSKSQEYQCARTCQQQYDEMIKHHRRGGAVENHHHPIEERYKECRSSCGQEQGQEKRECEQRCQGELEKQRREHGSGHRREYEQETSSRNNPYFFDSRRFQSRFRTEEGHIRVLERFSEKSELLQGIDNYRLAILEANPNTFVLPHHCDAESIFFVVGGTGTVSFVWEDKRQSHNLKQGELIRVPAGAIVYIFNSDDNEKFSVLKLLQSVNTPGEFEDFFGVGGENPESFYTIFSNEILEAAFNTPSEKLESFFGQQSQGVIIKVSKEQIQALSKEESNSKTSSKGKIEKKWNPINLEEQPPLFCSRFGQYFEATPNDHDQLKDLDVAVGFLNIKKGGMIEPYYNSRSTKLAYVVGGSGYIEMACPHLSSSHQRGGYGQKYEKVRAHVSVGDIFVVPAGHPVVMVASAESGLQLASFGINGAFNKKHFLAGKNNVWKEVEGEAKALSFGAAAEEVEEVLNRQKESYFVAAPERKERGRPHRIMSILDFAGF